MQFASLLKNLVQTATHERNMQPLASKRLVVACHSILMSKLTSSRPKYKKSHPVARKTPAQTPRPAGTAALAGGPGTLAMVPWQAHQGQEE